MRKETGAREDATNEELVRRKLVAENGRCGNGVEVGVDEVSFRGGEDRGCTGADGDGCRRTARQPWFVRLRRSYVGNQEGPV